MSEELAQVRKDVSAALFNAGYSNRKVSVKQFNCSMGLDVRIKCGSVDPQKVLDAVKPFKQEQTYDVTGDPYVGTGLIINVHDKRGAGINEFTRSRAKPS